MDYENETNEYQEYDFDQNYNDTVQATKKETEAKKPKRPRIERMTVDDEDQIPKKPETILEKPNDKKYEKQIKDLKDKITADKASIVEYKEKIKNEKIGNNPEIKLLRVEKDALNEKFDVVKKELDELKKTCDGVSDKVKSLRNIRGSLESELDVKNMDDFTDELRAIQKKLGYGSFNAVEEKKLIDKKAKLELQKPKIVRLNEATLKIKELNTKFGPQLKKIGEMVKKNKVLYEQKKEISTRLKAAYDQRQSNDPAIKELQEKVEAVKVSIDASKAEITTITAEWDDKWYHYEDQAALLDYIKRATDHINQLRKRTDKIRKTKEKAEKKARESGEAVEGEEDENVTVRKKEWFSYEIGQCEWLLKYFRNVTGEDVKAEKVAVTFTASQSKIEEDLKKGSLTVMKKNTDGVDTSKGFKNKKNTKKEKGNKKAASMLSLDLALITRVKDLGLSPPMNTDAVRPFIGELEGKLKFFHAEALKKESGEVELAAANNTHTEVHAEKPKVAAIEQKERSHLKPVVDINANVVDMQKARIESGDCDMVDDDVFANIQPEEEEKEVVSRPHARSVKEKVAAIEQKERSHLKPVVDINANVVDMQKARIESGDCDMVDDDIFANIQPEAEEEVVEEKKVVIEQKDRTHLKPVVDINADVVDMQKARIESGDCDMVDDDVFANIVPEDDE